MFIDPFFTASSKMPSELASDNQKVLKKTQNGRNVFDEKTKKHVLIIGSFIHQNTCDHTQTCALSSPGYCADVTLLICWLGAMVGGKTGGYKWLDFQNLAAFVAFTAAPTSWPRLDPAR
jgi:hypothetical protein